MVHETGTTSRASRKREAKQAQILEIAERLIAEQGIEAFSLHAVARELDVVTGTLYRYFPNKDALVAALHRRAIADLHERFGAHAARLSAALERVELRPKERVLTELCAASRFYLELPEQLPNRFRFVWLMLGDPRSLIRPEDVPKSAVPLLAFLGDVRALFERATQLGALSDGNALDRTLVFWSAQQGVVQLQKLQRYEAKLFDYRRLGAQLARPLLVGWGASQTALERAEQVLDQINLTSS
ncbi:MAG: helix-turn-helix transcriptional regulator [Polyangiaceae bacterium]|nr:helix-turn-helix transcriptional regulator [Polyangiaceae bacterium]